MFRHCKNSSNAKRNFSSNNDNEVDHRKRLNETCGCGKKNGKEKQRMKREHAHTRMMRKKNAFSVVKSCKHSFETLNSNIERGTHFGVCIPAAVHEFLEIRRHVGLVDNVGTHALDDHA